MPIFRSKQLPTKNGALWKGLSSVENLTLQCWKLVTKKEFLRGSIFWPILSLGMYHLCQQQACSSTALHQLWLPPLWIFAQYSATTGFSEQKQCYPWRICELIQVQSKNEYLRSVSMSGCQGEDKSGVIEHSLQLALWSLMSLQPTPSNPTSRWHCLHPNWHF